MKTHLPQRYVPLGRYPLGHRGAEKNKPIRNEFAHACAVSIFFVSLCLCGEAFAVQKTAEPLPGRLFYTPAQRVMLNAARTNQVTEAPKPDVPTSHPQMSAPVSFDGIITRSDGVATHWINGRPHVGRSSAKVRNLKPGQTRAAQQVYESYQVLRPTPPPAPATPRVKPATPDNEPLP